jgi:hypothetical protein
MEDEFGSIAQLQYLREEHGKNTIQDLIFSKHEE